MKKITGLIWHFFVLQPTFKSLCKEVGKNLTIESKLPQKMGSLDIYIGNDVRLSGHTSFIGTPFLNENSILKIGNKSYVGYKTTIAVGKSVKIGDNVLIASNCYIAGYNGHPTNSNDRAKNEAEKNIESIIIGDNVWIGTNCKIMKNISIGKNSIVAAGSVVTKDVSEDVIVAGNPARVVKNLKDK